MASRKTDFLCTLRYLATVLTRNVLNYYVWLLRSAVLTLYNVCCCKANLPGANALKYEMYSTFDKPRPVMIHVVMQVH